MSRVLLIDDDPVTRALLQRFLARWGHEVDAVERVVSAGAAEPSLVLLNVGQPWPAAVVLCRELKRHERLRVLPIVVMLDWVTPVIEGELRRAGAVEVLPRLIKLEELLQAVARAGEGRER